MLKRDLDGWHPREDVPITEAMGEQKLHGLKEVGRWWFEILRDGEPFPLLPDFEDGHWSEQALQVSPAGSLPPIANGSTSRTRTPMCHRSGCLRNLSSGAGKAAAMNTGSPPKTVSAIGWYPDWTRHATYSKLGSAPTPSRTRAIGRMSGSVRYPSYQKPLVLAGFGRIGRIGRFYMSSM